MKSILDSYLEGDTVLFQGRILESSIVSAKDGSKVARGALLIDGERLDWIGFNRKHAPVVGSLVDAKGKIGFYKGQKQFQVSSIVEVNDINSMSKTKKLIAYYRNCVEKEYQGSVIKSDLSKVPNFKTGANGLIESTKISSFTELNSDGDEYNWFKKVTLTGPDTTIMLGYPIIKKIYFDGTKKYAPIAYIDTTIALSSSGVTVTRVSEAVSWNYGALELLGIPLEERDHLRDLLIKQTSELGSDTERLANGIALLENYTEKLFGWDERFVEDKRSLDTSLEIIYSREVCFDGQANSVYEYLLTDLGDLLGKSDSELSKGPLGVILSDKENLTTENSFRLVSPLPTNIEQQYAVINGLNSELSCVTGPPGTGKSQFVANLASTAIANGLTVLVASKNNQAVDVAINRIRKSVPSSWPVRSGNRENRTVAASRLFEAINSEHSGEGLLVHLTELDSLNAKRNELEDLLLNFEYYKENINKELTSLSLVIADLDLELAQYEGIDFKNLLIDLIDLSSYLLKPYKFLQKKKQVSTRKIYVNDRFKNLSLTYSIPYLLDLAIAVTEKYNKNSIDPLKPAFDFIGVVKEKLEQLDSYREELNQKSKFLGSMKTLDELEVEQSIINDLISEISREIVRLSWDKLIDTPGKLKHLELLSIGLGSGFTNNIKSQIAQSLKVAPLWGVTNLSVWSSFPLEAGMFDLVIIDEASQCDIPSILPLLFRAKRAVIVGDPNQLQHITSIKNKESINIGAALGLDDLSTNGYNYSESSAFALCRRHTEVATTLKEHYRSHPAIAEFANKYVYNGELDICTNPIGYSKGDGVFWHDVSGKAVTNSEGGSLKNVEEARMVVKLIGELALTSSSDSIGVVTPFKEQAELVIGMVSKIKEYSNLDIRVATAHKFQGDERDIIILSTVVSELTPIFKREFANNLNLVNVSVTRARRQLHVVGSEKACLDIGGLLGSLANYSSRLKENKFESPAEESLYHFIDKSIYNVEQQVLIGDYRVDFLLTNNESPYKIIIECDGHPFHRNILRDDVRDSFLNLEGYKVIHISARDALKNKSKVNQRIRKEFI